MDFLAVTDHDVPPVDEVFSQPEREGVLLIPGVEYSTDKGHASGAFSHCTLPHTPAGALPFSEAAALIHGCGGVAVLAHPFQSTAQTVEERFEMLREMEHELDGVEICNRRATKKRLQANELAQTAAGRFQKPCISTAGSDAHLPEEIGTAFLKIECREKTLESLKAALAGGTSATFCCQPCRNLAIAESQKSSFKKSHAGPAAWMRWQAFLDIVRLEGLQTEERVKLLMESTLIKLGKKVKRFAKSVLLPAPKPVVSYVRRFERIKTPEKVCAMTFDDGPMDLPCAPDRFGGEALTDVLLDTLAEFGAKGVFDVVGDTSENYPDVCGPAGSPTWGGTAFDHYPEFGQDSKGGAQNCPRLIDRILNEGHQITNHGYRHIIFGKKPYVYGKRQFQGKLDDVTSDMEKAARAAGRPSRLSDGDDPAASLCGPDRRRIYRLRRLRPAQLPISGRLFRRAGAGCLQRLGISSSPRYGR